MRTFLNELILDPNIRNVDRIKTYFPPKERLKKHNPGESYEFLNVCKIMVQHSIFTIFSPFSFKVLAHLEIFLKELVFEWNMKVGGNNKIQIHQEALRNDSPVRSYEFLSVRKPEKR